MRAMGDIFHHDVRPWLGTVRLWFRSSGDALRASGILPGFEVSPLDSTSLIRTVGGTLLHSEIVPTVERLRVFPDGAKQIPIHVRLGAEQIGPDFWIEVPDNSVDFGIKMGDALCGR